MTNRTLLEVNQGMKKSRITTDWLFMNQRTKSETGWWLHSLKVKMGLISNISLVEVRLGCNNSLEWLPPCTGFLHHLASSIYWLPPSIGLLHLWPLPSLNIGLIKSLWACSIYPLCLCWITHTWLWLDCTWMDCDNVGLKTSSNQESRINQEDK